MLLPTLPEKKMAFKGLVTNKDENKLILTPLVHYALPGGSALITFEKAEGKSEKSPTTAERCGYSTLEPALLPFPGPGFGTLSPLPALWGFCPHPTVLSHIPAYGALGAGINPLCRGLSLLAVAQRIIEAKEHTVDLSCGEELKELDQCRVRVQAAPVDVLLPSALEVVPRASSALSPPCLCWVPSTCPACQCRSFDTGADQYGLPTDQAHSEQQEHHPV